MYADTSYFNQKKKNNQIFFLAPRLPDWSWDVRKIGYFKPCWSQGIHFLTSTTVTPVTALGSL